MRTFVKYIENQAYRSLNNRRFLINAFECYAKEENKSKKDLFNFVLFDKKEIVYSDSLYCNYDDLLAVFLY